MRDISHGWDVSFCAPTVRRVPNGITGHCRVACGLLAVPVLPALPAATRVRPRVAGEAVALAGKEAVSV